MKKVYKIMALTLIAVMLLGICACGKESKKNSEVGSWKCKYDATDYAVDNISSGFGVDLDVDTDYFISIYFELNEDGSFELGVDKDATIKSQDKLIDSMIDNLTEKAYEAAAAEGYDKDEADAQFVSEMGCSIREFYEKVFEAAKDQAKGEETVLEGYYRIKDGKIELSEDKDDFDDAIVLKYELKGDKLTIKSISGESDDLEEFMENKGIELPVKFTR